MSVLAELLERARAERDRRPVFIFDLDSTLFSTQERNHAILLEFVEAVGAPDDLRALVGTLAAADLGWNVMDDLRRRGFRHEPTLGRLRAFWGRRFFSSAYLAHDRPVPGASEYVNAVHEAGAHIFYLTGRDAPGMLKGTRLSLRTHGFPLESERVVLRLKPTAEEQDLAFKHRVIIDLATHGLDGPVLAAFENEPANANLFAERFPEARVVFLETVHSTDGPPPPLLPQIVRVRDFRFRQA